MPPKKSSQKKKDTIVELPGGALQTRFSIAQPNPKPRTRKQTSQEVREDETSVFRSQIHEQSAQGTSTTSDAPNPHLLTIRTRTKSKRLLQIDPLEPLTPAPPKAKKKSHRQPQPKTPIVVPSTFATRQVQNSQNRRAATVLYTPRTHRTGGAQPQQPQSPTPQSIHLETHSTLQPASQSILHETSAGTGDLSDSDSELEQSIGDALQALNLSRSSSGSSSPHAPRAGRHSKHQKKVALKPRGGAKDVWSFYEKKTWTAGLCVVRTCS